MSGPIRHANWEVSWEIPAGYGGGLVIRNARFKENERAVPRRVLFDARQPFVLVPYHTGSPEYKDGDSPDCGGVVLQNLTPIAPNAHSASLDPAKHHAENDREYDPVTNPKGGVWIERHGKTYVEPESLVLGAKFGVGNYQYVHRWEFRADGAIHPGAGLAGQLYRTEPGRPHVHNFYFRLDFDVDGVFNLVERFVHDPRPSGQGADRWEPLHHEAVEKFQPGKFTRWRVRHKDNKNSNGRHRSYEIILGSDDGPDGHYSSGDVWALRWRSAPELGAEVECRDENLTAKYANPAETIEGKDVVLWVVLRAHHYPREKGEETKVVPYHFHGFHIEPRDFLDATPTKLYKTDPPSP